MEYISAFNFAHEIVQTRTKKPQIDLNNIEFERAVLSTVSSIGKNYRATYVIHARKGGTEIIPFFLVVSSQLKKISI